MAKGKYITRIDDDISLPNSFEIQIDFSRNNQDYIMVGANAIIINNEGDFLYTSEILLDYTSIKEHPLINNFFHSAVMFRKDIFFKIEG